MYIQSPWLTEETLGAATRGAFSKTPGHYAIDKAPPNYKARDSTFCFHGVVALKMK
jgi:hypothetical protein